MNEKSDFYDQEHIVKQVNKMGKYHLDEKGKKAVAKFHEKNKPGQFDKKQQLEKIRAEYLKNKQEKDSK